VKRVLNIGGLIFKRSGTEVHDVSCETSDETDVEVYSRYYSSEAEEEEEESWNKLKLQY
jgi:hypothetical protein